MTVIVFIVKKDNWSDDMIVSYEGLMYRCNLEDLEYVGYDYARIDKEKLRPYK